ncbi:MAG: methylisocitrate lyase [Fimbriimonadaceae bacterium]|uniref:Methylisocitrate lyase n=1 Tax=Candidatus Nitrosymbiomonas proteolyticus TaxID=2608984 RepID=A0A809SE17_9BACT|nr:methylisocitrate lyase [Fimbriimonadaceae bacterium]NUM38766.1 methylisocitrate lyase [Armatimonadota bacterium]BBO23534.1 methylisocitrate lyase [Candidatus Nitrosymbiomonas proteolyticus]HQU19066.1 methylisocitrate lyase [Fimbriimonadaceae bacterium]
MLRPPLKRPGQVLRDLMSHGTVLAPGVFSALSARAAHAAGAKALYLSGAGVTNSLLAAPDIGLLGLDEMSAQARFVTQAAPLPVIADADTGYGEAWNVARTVVELERAGLAGIHLEDQVNPKRCGHLDGKQIVPTGQMVSKVRAAVDSKSDDSFLIVARTDARGVEGLSQAIDRARAYVDAGADMVFPEGLESESEFEAFRSAFDVPLLANMTEYGKTPLLPLSRFQSLGYNLVIFPMSAFRVMLRSMCEAYEELIRSGSQAALLERMKTRSELYELIEYAEYTKQDALWSGSGPTEDN